MRRWWHAAGTRSLTAAAAWLVACSGAEVAPPAPTPEPVVAPFPEGPLPALLVVHAWFDTSSGKPVPQPGKLVIWRTDGTRWESETVLDDQSNVFHKAIPWKEGILTIGGDKAVLRHWRKADGKWTPTTLWEQTWGGDHDRFRDVELGDVDGDGQDEIVLATHDQGVVAVGDEVDGKWTFVEMGHKPDTFVHEIEIGDVDGDGRKEFYATPSGRNRASMTSQPGGVTRWSWDGAAWEETPVVQWENSHAKEILVTDLGTGRDQLFIAVEAHTEKRDGKVVIVDPVRIVRMDRKDAKTWTETTVATLEDRQCRFLTAADLDGDGVVELIASGMTSGIWILQPQADGTFLPELIDKAATGFENAIDTADLDGDGKLELYAGSDDQRALRRYVWDGTGWVRTDIAKIPDSHLTWNVQDARL